MRLTADARDFIKWDLPSREKILWVNGARILRIWRIFYINNRGNKISACWRNVIAFDV